MEGHIPTILNDFELACAMCSTRLIRHWLGPDATSAQVLTLRIIFRLLEELKHSDDEDTLITCLDCPLCVPSVILQVQQSTGGGLSSAIGGRDPAREHQRMRPDLRSRRDSSKFSVGDQRGHVKPLALLDPLWILSRSALGDLDLKQRT